MGFAVLSFLRNRSHLPKNKGARARGPQKDRRIQMKFRKIPSATIKIAQRKFQMMVKINFILESD